MTAALVQNVVAGGTPSNNTQLILTISGITTTVGNHLIMCLAGRSSTGISSVVDSKGNTWQIDKDTQGVGASVGIASARITAALVNADTITITRASSDGFSASVAEYSGLATSSWFDKTAAVAGQATASASDSGATATTAQAGELLVGMTGHQSTVSSFAAEVLSPIWNLLTTVASVGTVQTVRPMYRVVAATGAYSAKATWTTNRVWGAAIATYKAAAPTGFPHSQSVVT